MTARAEVFWINGPVLKARPEGHFQMKEAVVVGEDRLTAEVIRLDTDSITVQVFEDTTSLKPGVLIEGSGLPLAVDLGPGMVGRMFDGIQRPLETIAADRATSSTQVSTSPTWIGNRHGRSNRKLRKATKCAADSGWAQCRKHRAWLTASSRRETWKAAV